MEPNDFDLIKDTLSGKNGSFEVLFKRYLPMCMYYFCRSRFLNTETAQDLVQEVFLKIYRSLSQFQIGTSFKAWLTTITRNTANDHFREQKVGVGSINIDPTDNICIDAEKSIIKKTMVQKAMDVLPEKQREIIELRYFWDMDSPEIGKLMDMPEGTVRSHLRQARIRLMEILEEGKEL